MLLKTLPFTLLGLSSLSIPFEGEAGQAGSLRESHSISIPPTLALPLIALLHTLAEPSLLYRSLNMFVQKYPDYNSSRSLVGQSLRSAIDLELRGYVNLVGGLENEIRGEFTALQHGHITRTIGVTLKRCIIWTREATMGLRLMSQVVNNTKGKFPAKIKYTCS